MAFVRKIAGLGRYTAIVSIPKEFMQKLNWRRGQKVVVSLQKDSLKIKDYPNK